MVIWINSRQQQLAGIGHGYSNRINEKTVNKVPHSLVKTANIQAFDLALLSEQLLSYWQNLQGRIDKHINHDAELVDEDGNPVSQVARYVQRCLIEFVKTQQQQVEQSASAIQMKLYNQFLYAASALIDEQILEHFDWKIEREWLQLMLELTLFKSRNSGERLINHMEQLANEPHNFSRDEKDLAAIYIKVIWLGFDGKYEEQPEKLQGLVEKLLTSAELELPELGEKALFEQAYKYNINPDMQSRLAPISRWHRYGLYAFLGYLVLSAIVWFGLTKDLNELLNNLLNIHGGGNG